MDNTTYIINKVTNDRKGRDIIMQNNRPRGDEIVLIVLVL